MLKNIKEPMSKFLISLVIVVALVAISLTVFRRTNQKTNLSTNVSTQNPSPADVISIESNRFIPTSTTVSVGDSITFTNNDTTAHQISSDPHPTHTIYPPLNLELLNTGESGNVAFTKKGIFGYHDHLNPSIKGQVVVE